MGRAWHKAGPRSLFFSFLYDAVHVIRGEEKENEIYELWLSMSLMDAEREMVHSSVIRSHAPSASFDRLSSTAALLCADPAYLRSFHDDNFMAMQIDDQCSLWNYEWPQHYEGDQQAKDHVTQRKIIRR